MLKSNQKPAELNPEAELAQLRVRLAELEAENQSLYQQYFQVREQLASVKLDEKERAEFLSNVAHELRSPLTSIKGYIDLMLEGETGTLSDLQYEFLCVVGANSDRLARIITDLLEVSRLESGRYSFKPSPAELRPLLLTSVDSIRPQLEAKKIQLQLDLPSAAASYEINTDTERLSQAIRVLLSNAGRYTKNGGTVRIGLEAKGEQIALSVEDEGPYISPEEITKVFTKFWKPEDPAWRENGNPGLGLAIVKALVELHDGKVEVVSKAEVGNVFTITLPLLRKSAYDFVPRQVEQTEKAVLVISPNLEFGKAAEKLLMDGGFQVVISENRDGLTTSTPAWQPDLILEETVSSELPEPAWEVTRGANVRKVPILQLKLSDLECRALKAGALAVLPWPTSDEELQELLAQAIAAEFAPPALEKLKQSESVLLVSQINTTLRTLDKILREAGYSHVYRATREYDALTLARRHRPVMLLVDLASEDGPNPALLEALREDPLLAKTAAFALVPPEYILATTGPDYNGKASGSFVQALQDGALYTNYVPKPFLRRRFLNLARRLTTDNLGSLSYESFSS